MENCRRIAQAREKTRAALQAQGFEVLQSQTNFLFARHPALSSAQLQAALRTRGILIRRWDAPRIAQWSRITIGTAEQMEAFV